MADLLTAFPSTVGIQAINFRTNTPTQVSETMSGKFRRVGMGISYYTWETRLANLTPRQAGAVNGFVSQCLGPQFSFEITLPEISYTKLATQTSSTPSVSANYTVGSTSVLLANCGNTQNVLAAGDFFKFSNHSKVYMCVADCVSNSGGTATLYFSCPLVAAVSVGSTVRINAVPFTVVLSEDSQSHEVGIGGITNISLNMREVW